MKILIIGRSKPSIDTGMHGIFEYEQAVGLSRIGHDVSYIYCDVRSIKYQKKFLKVRKKHKNISIAGYHIPIGGIPQNILLKIRQVFLLKALKEMVTENGYPDIIHIHFPLIVLDMYIWKKLKEFPCKIIITEHWTKTQLMQLSESEIKLLNLIGKEADTIISVSEDLKKSIMKYFTIFNVKREIIVLPNMVRNDFYTMAKNSNGNSKIFTFLFTGRLVLHKNCHLLIDAFESIFERNDMTVQLIIIGNGKEYDSLKQMARNYNDSRIIMKGIINRKDIVSYYKECDVFVSASELETFGVPFIEAWSCGKPIICANSSPIMPYVKEGFNGWTFKVNDRDDLAAKLYEVRENRLRIPDEKIKEWAYNNFSEEAVINKINDVYESFTVQT
ncbi:MULTISPECIES: glycosyltransferase family 4 protein [Eubacterium]|uniref:Glycosyltransferase involved in cell wall bisynthesis n=1 Tax=Eubacterium barkeri TaxID=1528 RepID=A0A1H3GHI0_EUBBA|nr:glycosyltransferase family 4 protein [Eubacterium barkeri]SDY01749.1 Glycosyltransferase involved in cell wall bisynthesis [Eubacterium barkeri]